jgi:cardiolipin synthase
MLCDDDIAVVGTANFDNRSFRLDFELAAVLFGPPANRRLAEGFDRDCGESRELTRSDLAAAPFPRGLGAVALAAAVTGATSAGAGASSAPARPPPDR